MGVPKTEAILATGLYIFLEVPRHNTLDFHSNSSIGMLLLLLTKPGFFDQPQLLSTAARQRPFLILLFHTLTRLLPWSATRLNAVPMHRRMSTLW